MTSYRRFRTPGASYFFTAALSDRGSEMLVRHIDTLRRAVAATLMERPFVCDAAVILPDHLHMIWTLPENDADFSTRWRLIKSRFSRGTGVKAPRGRSQVMKQERGVWQRRFWEHRIRDDQDFANHVQYCWGNPVKHGLVQKAVDWPYSSVHRDHAKGIVPREWIGMPDGEYGEP